MKVAIQGNIANNAYLLAKGLRRLGVEADSFDQGGGWVFPLPIWEDGDFDFHGQGYDAARELWEVSAIRTENDFRRPTFAKILGNDGKDVEPWYDTQEDFERHGLRVLRGRHVKRSPVMQRYDLLNALERSRTPEALWEEVLEYHLAIPDWRAQRDLIVKGGYDLAVLCGTYAMVGPLLPRDVPYITFEHATMRDVPQLRTAGQRLLAYSYQQADHNVITNADCWEAAGALGIRHKSTFIPHPMDDQKFTPAESGALAQTLRDWLHCELLFLAPARHSSNEAVGAKRNDRILYAFHRYVHQAEPAGAPKAGLVLFAWGTPADLDASRGLIDALGLADRVHWQVPLPRPRLVQFYRAADVVLDQFSDGVGSFGTTTVEAMACGKPVITFYNPAVHEWCAAVLPEHPPVVRARTTDEIYDALVYTARHPQERDWRGREGRRWVERYHTLGRVAALHKTLYERVLNGCAEVEEAPTPIEEAEGRVLEEAGRTQ